MSQTAENDLAPMKAFLTAGPHRKLTALAQLPPFLHRELEDEPLADVGASYQVGCVVRGAPLPLSRLLYALAADERCLLHIESGGFAHTYRLRLYEKKGTGAHLLCATYVPEPMADGAAILAFLEGLAD